MTTRPNSRLASLIVAMVLAVGCGGSNGGGDSSVPEPRLRMEMPFDITADTASATMNTVDVMVTVAVGETLEVGTCATLLAGSGSGIDSATGIGTDTLIRLLRGGHEIRNDDHTCTDGDGLGSYISETVAVGGVHTISVGCFSDSMCSGVVVWQVTAP